MRRIGLIRHTFTERDLKQPRNHKHHTESRHIEIEPKDVLMAKYFYTTRTQRSSSL